MTRVDPRNFLGCSRTRMLTISDSITNYESFELEEEFNFPILASVSDTHVTRQFMPSNLINRHVKHLIRAITDTSTTNHAPPIRIPTFITLKSAQITQYVQVHTSPKQPTMIGHPSSPPKRQQKHHSSIPHHSFLPRTHIHTDLRYFAARAVKRDRDNTSRSEGFSDMRRK